MQAVLRSMKWVVAGLPFLSVQSQSFTQTIGGMMAQDGIGAMIVGDGYTVGVRDYSSGAYTGLVHAMSSSGSLTSTSALAGSGPLFLQGLSNAPDGTAWLFGSSIDQEEGDHGTVLCKLDGTGSITSTTFGNSVGSVQYFGAVALADGGVVACGTRATGEGHDVVVARHDPSGQEVWSYTHPGATDAEAHGIALDGTDLLITGRQMNFSGSSDVLLLRMHVDGTFIWSTTLGGSANEEGRAVVSIGGNAFAIAGWTESFGTFDQSSQSIPRHAFLAAVDLDGDTLWTRTLGDTLHGHQAFALVHAASGDLLLGGERFNSGVSDGYLARLTATGDLVWERTVDTGKEERLLHMLPLPDDGVVCTGWSFGPFGRQVLFLRRSALGY